MPSSRLLVHSGALPGETRLKLGVDRLLGQLNSLLALAEAFLLTLKLLLPLTQIGVVLLANLLTKLRGENLGNFYFILTLGADDCIGH